MSDLVPQVEALTQFTSELDARLAGAGIGGIEAAVAVYERLRGVFEGVSVTDLERMAARVAHLQTELAAIDRRLAVLRELKATLDRVESPR